MKDFQEVFVNKRFVDKVQETIFNIENPKSEADFKISVGKLIGLVDWFGDLNFKEDK